MLIVTINEIPGKKLEALGVVRGSTVQSRNLGHDMMAGFRTLVGGEVTDYADMLTEARQIATGRMVQGPLKALAQMPLWECGTLPPASCRAQQRS